MKTLYKLMVLLVLLSVSQIQAQEYATHFVKSGETLQDLAKQYHTTIADIYALNPEIKSYTETSLLKENSVLIIKKGKPTNPTTNTTTTTTQQPKTETVTETIRELTGFKKHKVKRKETLYGLSKKYGVTELELKTHNPELYKTKLKKGQKIQIPIYTTKQVVKEVKKPTRDYVVQAKEGKWRIAYKFGITIDELEALNPNLSAVLQEGQILQVPNLEANQVKQVDEQYSYYTVLPKEGFYRLEIKLGVSQQELETLNPSLKEGGLKAGMVLKIPYQQQVITTATTTETPIDLTTYIRDFNTKKIAVLLPFRLNKITLESVVETKDKIQHDPYLSTSLDFYSGVKIAVDSLQKLGINLQLDVYDTKNQTSEITTIIHQKQIQQYDAIIGPLLSKNFQQIATAVKQSNIPVISPNLKTIKPGGFNVFQSQPTTTILEDKIIDYVKKDVATANIIIISDSKNAAVKKKLKNTFPAAIEIDSRKNKQGEDANYILEGDILKHLKPGKNIVFLETQEYIFVSNATSMLNGLNTSKQPIILMTTNYNKAFDNDEVSNTHLSNLQLHYPSTDKAYDENSNTAFIRQYKTKYGELPNTTAVRGFDIMLDVVLRLVSSKNLYSSVSEFPVTEYVESKFLYQKDTSGSYANTAAYVVKFENLKIVEAAN